MLVKKLLPVSMALATLAAIGMSTQAAAGAPGFYVGAQAGWGDVHQSGISANDLSNDLGLPINTFSGSSKDTGIAGRGFVGYQFNPYFAVESGYTLFSNMTTRANGSFGPFSISESGKVSTQAIDLLGKGILPLSNGFSLYGKAGAAYLISKATANVTTSGFGLSSSGSASQTNSKLYPAFGAGVSYDITPNVVTDISYNRIQKVGSSDAVGSTDFIGLGLAYNFG